MHASAGAARAPAVRPALLAALVAVGLVFRLAILWHTGALAPAIVDERHYVELSTSLVEEGRFAWHSGERTSLRPPLYPAFVAGLWSIAGSRSLQVVRLAQIVLSLLTAALVFELGRRAFTPRVGAMAAAITWLYPELIFLDLLILTETLFTFWLVLFVLLAVMLIQRARWHVTLLCGVALGLGALTRSVLWPLPLVLCPLLVVVTGGSLRRRLAVPALVLLGYLAVVTPWAVRNTRLQGVFTVVDTMGGMNLRMGNYEYTPEDRTWDAVSLKGEKNWVFELTQETEAGLSPAVITEGVKDKWAQRKALAYMREHPGTTLRRSLLKFADFWGLERSFIAGVQQGIYHPPPWFTVLTTVCMLVAYTSIAMLGFAGLWLARLPEWRAHAVLLLPVIVITGVHVLVFGHSRYHVPLVPLLALYASALVERGLRVSFARPGASRVAATLSILLLVAIWARQILVVDGERIRAALGAF